jgi:hypothetical protein
MVCRNLTKSFCKKINPLVDNVEGGVIFMQYTLYIKRDGNILDTQKITSDRIPQNGETVVIDTLNGPQSYVVSDVFNYIDEDGFGETVVLVNSVDMSDGNNAQLFNEFYRCLSLK